MTDHESQADQTAEAQRAMQQQQRETPGKKEEVKGAVQAGARRYPEPPFPQNPQDKPGTEAELDPPPMYDAPFYKGSGKLQDKVAVITGGDSGIGRAVAVLFAREGADVAIVHLDEERDAADTVKAIEKEGRRGLAIAGDVQGRDFCFDAVRQVVEAFGRVDVLVNNAAFQLHVDRFEDLTEARLMQTLHVNLGGYFHMAQACVPHMGNGSAIVNTGSVTGIMGNQSLLDYSTTKGGIHAFTRSLGTHLAPRGIRVNCVAPGPVWTPLNPADKDDVSQFGAQTVMKRPAQPEEIAPAYVFLASPQCSSYITGEVLPIIGGYGGG